MDNPPNDPDPWGGVPHVLPLPFMRLSEFCKDLRITERIAHDWRRLGWLRVSFYIRGHPYISNADAHSFIARAFQGDFTGTVADIKQTLKSKSLCQD